MTSEIIVAVVGGLALLGAGVLTYFSAHGKTQADTKTALDKRIDDRVALELNRVYKRLEEVEEKGTDRMSAVARILRSIARQWPDPHGPNLDPKDLAVIEDTVPPTWFRRPPATSDTHSPQSPQ